MFEGTSVWRWRGKAYKINMTWFPALGNYKIWWEKDNRVWNFMRTRKWGPDPNACSRIAGRRRSVVGFPRQRTPSWEGWMNWASEDFMPERGRKKRHRKQGSWAKTQEAEREWLLGWGALGKTVGIHFSPVTFSLLSSLRSGSVPSLFSPSISGSLIACNQLCMPP